MHKFFEVDNVKTSRSRRRITWEYDIKTDLKEWKSGVDSSGSGWEPVADSLEYCTEAFEFHNKLGICWLTGQLSDFKYKFFSGKLFV
jgi:hypothetical protein